MTYEQSSLLSLLVFLTLAFLVNRAPIDLVALVGLLLATALGVVSPVQAFSGFASAAVITMVAVFFLSAAMRASGANEACGELIFRGCGGKAHVALLLTVLLTAFVSAFMNNVAAVALMLPATITLSRRLSISPSQLLMPMSFGAVLGGMTTLIGTPPNLIAAELLQAQGMGQLGFHDFFASGVIATLVGTAVMGLFAFRLLPHSGEVGQKNPELAKLYELFQHAYAIRIPPNSPLIGKTLMQVGASAALDAQVVAVIRRSESVLAPVADFRFQANDLAILGGEQDDLTLLKGFASCEAVEGLSKLNPSFSAFTGAVVRLKSSEQGWAPDRLSAFGVESGIFPLFVRRDGQTLMWKSMSVQPNDEIIVLGPKHTLDQLRQSQSLDVDLFQQEIHEFVTRSVFALRISEASPEGVLGACDLLQERLGISLLALQREEKLIDVEQRAVQPQQGDYLLFRGEGQKVQQLKELLSVESVDALPRFHLESGNIGVAEIVVSPRSKLIAQSLAEIKFRERYGFRVLSVWREGKPLFQGLARQPLRVGDALLIHGPRGRLELLKNDPDFLLLSGHEASDIVPWKIATVAVAAFLLVLLPVLGIMPAHFAAVVAACFLCCCGTVKVAEAYRHVEWRIVIFTAALLPLGMAIEHTGLGAQLGQLLTDILGTSSPILIAIALALLASIISQILDGPIAVLIVTPIALSLARSLGMNAQTLVLLVAQAASIAFLFPVSHKAHLLVLGPGAYRTQDFCKLGIVVSIAVFLALVFAVLAFFPLI